PHEDADAFQRGQGPAPGKFSIRSVAQVVFEVRILHPRRQFFHDVQPGANEFRLIEFFKNAHHTVELRRPVGFADLVERRAGLTYAHNHGEHDDDPGECGRYRTERFPTHTASLIPAKGTPSDSLKGPRWRGGRAVECGGLENR